MRPGFEAGLAAGFGGELIEAEGEATALDPPGPLLGRGGLGGDGASGKE